MAKSRYYGRSESQNPLFDNRAWEIAALTLAIVTLLLCTLSFTFYSFQASTFLKGLLGFLFGIFSLAASFFLGMILRNWTESVSEYFVYFLIGTVFTLIVVAVGFAGEYWLFYFWVMLLFALLQATFVGCLVVFFSGRITTLSFPQLLLWLLLVLGVPALDIGCIYWINNSGDPIEMAAVPDLEADPSDRGDFPFEAISYGKWAAQPDSAAAFNAEPLDISANWLHQVYWEQYCGFGLQNLPIQGRFFYPATNDTVPVVLLLAGQHYLETASSAGMDYLGEHLASNGIACLLVDLAFLDKSWAGMLKGDTKRLRSILLSENLTYLKKQLAANDSTLSRRILWDRMGIIAQGENNLAVAELIANIQANSKPGAFAKRKNWEIIPKAWLAIAPPAKLSVQPFALSPLHYLSIGGSHDEKVPGNVAYRNLPNFNRDSAQFNFELGCYWQGANHAQFNTNWGRSLLPFPDRWLQHREGMLSPEMQQKALRGFALVFMRGTLSSERTVNPDIFSSERLNWLPNLRFSTHYQQTAAHTLLNFDEDPNPITATLDSATLSMQGFDKHYETDRFLPQALPNNQQLVLSWGGESSLISNGKTAPTLRIIPPLHFFESHRAAPSSSLRFKLATLPSGNADSLSQKPLNFSIVLVDTLDIKTKVTFSNFGRQQVQPKVEIVRLPFIMDEYEEMVNLPVTQVYALPFTEIFRINPGFEFSLLKEILFVFDKSPSGRILLDDVAFYGLKPNLPGVDNE